MATDVDMAGSGVWDSVAVCVAVLWEEMDVKAIGLGGSHR